MNEVCEKCGLPKSICVCGEIAKESQKIKISTAQRRFRKLITRISGIESEEHAKQIEKLLKRRLACGGTLKGTEIELQGAHREKVKQILLEQGFKKELIED